MYIYILDLNMYHICHAILKHNTFAGVNVQWNLEYY